MRRDAIWLISGGPMQKIAAARILRRGLALILSDGNPEPYCRDMADRFVHVDTFDVDGHLTAARELSNEFNIRAVVTVAADCHFTVNTLAKHLGLHHLSPTISDSCRNKAQTRRILTDAGLPQPAFITVSSFEEAVSYVENINVDHVIKATDNSGSRGFSVAPRGHPLSLSQYQAALSMGTTQQVLIEERLLPDETQISEASVETLWQNGQMYWINWVDRIFPRDLAFIPQLKVDVMPKESIEIGHINPARRSNEIKDHVHRDIERAGLALGMGRMSGAHILKADMYFSNRGPIILELTPRTSGGWDSSGSSLARGAEIADGAIHIAMGNHVDLNAWFAYFEFKYPETTAVVVTQIPDGAEDCIGRQFALAHGYESTEIVFSRALNKLRKGELHVPVL